MTSPEPSAEAAQRGPALLLASLLLAAGVLIPVSVVMGMVTTADSSPTTSSVMAAAVAVLPGVLAVVLALRRPVLGLAAAAGGGVVGLVRLLADLAVITETDRISRPELFAETTDRARPLSAGAGAWLLLTADLLMLVVGLVAASRLAGLVGSPRDSGAGDLFGPPSATPLDADQVSDTDDSDGAGADSAVVQALTSGPQPRRPLNLPMVGVGFLGALLLLVGGLGTPYVGGYLDLRILPFGTSLIGLVAAALLAFLAAVVVLIAAALPRSIARALLCGTAVAAAVPSLTAVVAVLGGAPTSLSPVVWWGLAGAVLLAASGLLVRRPDSTQRAVDAEGRPPEPWFTLGTGVLALLAAGALAGASTLPLLYLDGAAPDAIAGSALAPAGPAFLVAAVPLAVAAILSLVPAVAASGRAAVAVLWAGAVYALGQALWAASLVQTSAGGSSTGITHVWSAGPGQWLAWLGTAAAVVAGVLAVVTSRRDADACTDVVDDDSLSASRAARRWPAVALTVVVVVALALPVWSEPGLGSVPTLLHGYDLDTWGFWALAIGAVGAVWVAALTRRPLVAVALLVSAACLVGQPLFLPAAVRDTPGFALSAGFYAGAFTALLLLAAAAWFAVVANRIQVRAEPAAVLTDILPPPPAWPVQSTVQSRGEGWLTKE